METNQTYSMISLNAMSVYVTSAFVVLKTSALSPTFLSV